MQLTKSILAGVVSLCVASFVGAGTVVTITGDLSQNENNDDPGNFIAKMSYDADAGALNFGLLTVEIANTTASGNGTLTGFAFANDTAIAGIDSFELSTRPSNDWVAAENLNGEPFGRFGYGAKTGNTLQGGDPSAGIAASDPNNPTFVTFVFDVSGSAADSLTVHDFLTANSKGHFFLARFQSLANDGSDKVPGLIILIPAPAALPFGMAGLAMVGLGAGRRRRG